MPSSPRSPTRVYNALAAVKLSAGGLRSRATSTVGRGPVPVWRTDTATRSAFHWRPSRVSEARENPRVKAGPVVVRMANDEV